MKEYDFYVVPTPIGNLGDISLRAIEILKKVDIIACEDIRVTQKLLNFYEIKTKCVSYHKFNEKERISYFLEILSKNQKIALVSDAGTPLFCDPGSVIVNELRKNNYTVTSLPGANAVATFLSQISRNSEDFIFLGFLPKSKTKIQEVIKEYSKTDIVFYDSPNRILNTLNVIKEIRPDCKCAIGRELTKIFEEIVIDKIDNVLEYFSNSTVKGEFVGLIFREEIANTNLHEISEKILILKSKGFKSKEIATILSEFYDINKNDIYKMSI